MWRRSAHPVRLTLAHRLGHGIDGAWWPHTASVAGELPELLAALHRPLGDIVGIRVNWTSCDGVPDFNSLGWRNQRPRVMTVTGENARATLLVVPHLTHPALALMVLRQAATLPIHPTEHETRAFSTAHDILRAAHTETARCAT
jgi:Family of unknown function (DUF5994)